MIKSLKFLGYMLFFMFMGMGCLMVFMIPQAPFIAIPYIIITVLLTPHCDKIFTYLDVME